VQSEHSDPLFGVAADPIVAMGGGEALTHRGGSAGAKAENAEKAGIRS
jgi:hypothetical protein